MWKGQKSIRKKVENVPLFAWFVKPWNENPVHSNSKSGNWLKMTKFWWLPNLENIRSFYCVDNFELAPISTGHVKEIDRGSKTGL